MARPKSAQPAYTLHKPSGQARVRINGKDHYLGEHGSAESWQLYHQLLADECGTAAPSLKLRDSGSVVSVGKLALAYLQFAKDYYGPNAAQIPCIKSALRPLGIVDGKAEGKWHQLPVKEFTPLRLQQVLEARVNHGDRRDNKTNRKLKFKPLCRSTVNASLRILKKIFHWGVQNELVPVEVYAALATVDGLRKGKGKLAPFITEPEKVKPAPEKDVLAAMKEAGPEIAAMIELQILTGMRPDEVTIMRPSLIAKTVDPKGQVWGYYPDKHKNDWREGEQHELREVLLGPKAQKVLMPFLQACRSQDDYLFSPVQVQARSIERQRKEAGKEPSLVKLSKIKPPRPCYDDASYRQAVRRACKRAKVPIWTPNQLRHNAATSFREQFGIEIAQLPLGHKHTKTTEIYAEKNRKQYLEMIAQAG